MVIGENDRVAGGASPVCSPKECASYTGGAVGYCRVFRVIMKSEDEKTYFSSHCAREEDLEADARMEIALRYLYDVKRKEVK